MKVLAVAVILLAWLIIPTGTPDDVLTIWIIKQLGIQVWFGVVLLLVIIMWRLHLNAKKIKIGLKQIVNSGKRMLK